MNIPNKILIIQLRRVGDVIFTLPVIGKLRQHFPNAKIDFLVEKPSDQMVGLNPHLNETLVYDKDRPLHWVNKIRNRKYDWVLDYHSNGRTLMLTLFSGAKIKAGFKGPMTRAMVYNRLIQTSHKKYLVDQKLDILKALGIETSTWNWDLKVPSKELSWAEQIFKYAGVNSQEEKIIGIAPATRRPIRSWDPENFRKVAQSITKANYPVLLLYGPGERNLVNQITVGLDPKKTIIPPESSLLELAALIKNCSCVLALDNGPKNMAVSLDVPTFTLSGPTNPLSFNPHKDPAHVLIRSHHLFCISCGLNSCPYKHECMTDIKPETVIEKIETFLKYSEKELVKTF